MVAGLLRLLGRGPTVVGNDSEDAGAHEQRQGRERTIGLRALDGLGPGGPGRPPPLHASCRRRGQSPSVSGGGASGVQGDGVAVLAHECDSGQQHGHG